MVGSDVTYVKPGDPIDIFAIVNYKRFWDSGMAREMFDEFFSKLPYPPPVLYIDVLTTTAVQTVPGAEHAVNEMAAQARIATPSRDLLLLCMSPPE